MLPRIVLTLAQLAIAWNYAPQLRSFVGINFNTFDIFLLAVIIAVIVWLVGHIGGLVLKDTPPPSPATLTACLVLALVGAALTLVPQVPNTIDKLLNHGGLPLKAYPLIGAVIGYLVRR